MLAELDLVSGRLRYLAAGHPYPLLMRDGRVVKSLTGGRRSLFGLPTANMSVAEEFLEPGDWLTLYTDGITKARDEAGHFFGEERLVDFLRREPASSHPPPETVRRLVHAVMRHQRGVLQDDATILLARWDAQLRPERRHHVLPLSRRVRRRTAEYLGVLVPERQGVGMAVGRGEDLVPAVVRLRLPRPADPATVEALLARAMAAADPPIAAELAWVPLLSAAPPADPVLTYALVLQPGSTLRARDPHDLLIGARRAAKTALKNVLGPGTKVGIRVADSPEILAACSRAIAGNPRAGNPYQA